MFRHVPVPIDLSARSHAAALRLAPQNRARVTLLHVIQRIDHIPAREVRAFYRRLEQAARKKMEAVSRRFAAKRVDFRPSSRKRLPERANRVAGGFRDPA